jgi:hypothetical protein
VLAQVPQLHDELGGDEEVQALDVPVEDPLGVQVRDSPDSVDDHAHFPVPGQVEEALPALALVQELVPARARS